MTVLFPTRLLLTRLALVALWFQVHLVIARAGELQIDGQVFIATKGGDNIKLALVPVGLYPAEQMRGVIAAKVLANAVRSPKIEAMYAAMNKLYVQAGELQDSTFKASLADIDNEQLSEIHRRAEKA